jgi:WD40 repeat protein
MSVNGLLVSQPYDILTRKVHAMPEVSALLDPANLAPSTAANSAPEFDVFVSYSRKDKHFCALLERSLRAYKPPRGLDLARRLSVFRDTSDLVGTDYFVSIDGYLRRARKLIIICSPHARSSEYVNDEICRFVAARGTDNIIPIIIAGFPNNEAKPEEKAAMAFPDALCSALKMPLAIDYRGFDVKKRKLDRGTYAGSWYTLIASILGRNREEIEERERKRAARARRITTAITSSVIGVLVVFLGIALWQWWVAQTRTISADIKASNASFANRDYWGALKAGLQAAQIFHTLPFAERARPPIRPELSQSVQQALYNVREYKRLVCKADCNFATRQSTLGQITWSPNGKTIAFVSRRDVVTLWDPDDNARKSIHPIYPQEGNDEVRSVGWRTINGKTLLTTSSKKGFINVLDPNEGQPLTSTKLSVSGAVGSPPYVWGTSWRPDGQQLVAIPGPSNRGFDVLMPDDAHPNSVLSHLAHYKIHPVHVSNNVFKISWGPTPIPWLAVGDLNQSVWLYNSNSEDDQEEDCGRVGSYMGSVAWRPDATALAVGLYNGTIQLFNVETGHCRKGPLLSGLDGQVDSLSWSSNGRLAAVSDNDKEIRWWDINGALSSTSDNPTEVFYMPAVAGGIRWSPDGKTLAVLDQSGSVHLLKDNSLLKTVPAPANAPVSWSPDGKLFAYTNDKHGVSISNREGSPIGSLPNEAFGNGGAFAISWHPNGKIIAIGSGDGNVTVWDIDTLKKLDQFNCDDWAQSVSWNPKDKKGLLAVGCHNTKGAYLLRWDSDTQKFDSDGKRKRLHDTKGKEITAENIRVSWSPDGKKLAISANSSITLTNNDGAHIRTIPTPDEVGKVAWSLDSRMFAVPSANVVKLFKVVRSSEQDDLPITVFKGHTHKVTSVTWNNQTLVSASEDGTVKLWQIDKDLADNPLDTLVKQSCIWLADYLDKNRLVAKDDSDLQDLCSKVQTAAPPVPVRPPAAHEETKRAACITEPEVISRS